MDRSISLHSHSPLSLSTLTLHSHSPLSLSTLTLHSLTLHSHSHSHLANSKIVAAVTWAVGDVNPGEIMLVDGLVNRQIQASHQ